MESFFTNVFFYYYIIENGKSLKKSNEVNLNSRFTLIAKI